MGVHGLWTLISPYGRRIDIATLRGKVLAIDASIWLTQFVKAMRHADGSTMAYAHLLGTFRRVMKLLVLRIKPVFVFDGGAPILKRRTVLLRQQRRGLNENQFAAAARRLLLVQLQKRRLSRVAAAVLQEDAQFTAVSRPIRLRRQPRSGSQTEAGSAAAATMAFLADVGHDDTDSDGNNSGMAADMTKGIPKRETHASDHNTVPVVTGAAHAVRGTALEASREDEDMARALELSLQQAFPVDAVTPQEEAVPGSEAIGVDHNSSDVDDAPIASTRRPQLSRIGTADVSASTSGTVAASAAPIPHHSQYAPAGQVAALSAMRKKRRTGAIFGDAAAGAAGGRGGVEDQDVDDEDDGVGPFTDSFMPNVPEQVGDIDLSVVSMLPSHLQKAYVEELRRKLRSENRDRLLPHAGDAAAISRAQMDVFLGAARFNADVTAMNVAAAAAASSASLPARRIASESQRHFVLLRDGESTVDGGTILLHKENTVGYSESTVPTVTASDEYVDNSEGGFLDHAPTVALVREKFQDDNRSIAELTDREKAALFLRSGRSTSAGSSSTGAAESKRVSVWSRGRGKGRGGSRSKVGERLARGDSATAALLAFVEGRAPLATAGALRNKYELMLHAAARASAAGDVSTCSGPGFAQGTLSAQCIGVSISAAREQLVQQLDADANGVEQFSTHLADNDALLQMAFGDDSPGVPAEPLFDRAAAQDDKNVATVDIQMMKRPADASLEVPIVTRIADTNCIAPLAGLESPLRVVHADTTVHRDTGMVHDAASMAADGIQSPYVSPDTNCDDDGGGFFTTGGESGSELAVCDVHREAVSLVCGQQAALVLGRIDDVAQHMRDKAPNAWHTYTAFGVATARGHRQDSNSTLPSEQREPHGRPGSLDLVDDGEWEDAVKPNLHSSGIPLCHGTAVDIVADDVEVILDDDTLDIAAAADVERELAETNATVSLDLHHRTSTSHLSVEKQPGHAESVPLRQGVQLHQIVSDAGRNTTELSSAAKDAVARAYELAGHLGNGGGSRAAFERAMRSMGLPITGNNTVKTTSDSTADGSEERVEAAKLAPSGRNASTLQTAHCDELECTLPDDNSSHFVHTAHRIQDAPASADVATLQQSAPNLQSFPPAHDLSNAPSPAQDEALVVELAEDALQMASVRRELLWGAEHTNDVAAPALSTSTAHVVAGETDGRLVRITDALAGLEADEAALTATSRRAARDASSVTPGMIAEVAALLELFGLPVVYAPMEAEAQCAALEAAGLVDGIVTDDSDAFLFGARVVYRHLFDDTHHVEEYRADDLAARWGVTRDDLIRSALLLGSDYCEGVAGIGPVNAAEIITAFPGDDGLRAFRDWLINVTSDEPAPPQRPAKVQAGKRRRRRGVGASGSRDRSDDEKGNDAVKSTQSDCVELFKYKHRNARRRWVVDPTFPSSAVLAAYRSPTVDTSYASPFAFSLPDGAALTAFAVARFGWDKSRAQAELAPLLREVAAGPIQMPIEAYLQRAPITYDSAQPAALIKSTRLRAAVTTLAGGNASVVASIVAQTSSDVVSAAVGSDVVVRSWTAEIV